MDSGLLLSCICLLGASACSPIPDYGRVRSDAAVGDGGAACGDRCGARPSRVANHFVQSSGQLQGRSDKYRLQLSAGMPEPVGAGESRRFRLRLGPEARVP